MRSPGSSVALGRHDRAALVDARPAGTRTPSPTMQSVRRASGPTVTSSHSAVRIDVGRRIDRRAAAAVSRSPFDRRPARATCPDSRRGVPMSLNDASRDERRDAARRRRAMQRADRARSPISAGTPSSSAANAPASATCTPTKWYDSPALPAPREAGHAAVVRHAHAAVLSRLRVGDQRHRHRAPEPACARASPRDRRRSACRR